MTKDNSDHDHAKDADIVTTKSVNSIVIPPGAEYEFADVHNGEVECDHHVMLMDWDDTSQRKATKWAGDLPGITLVLESSPGSYHAWNLCVDDHPDTAMKLITNHDDRAHVEAGIKRGYWRIRYTPKNWEYKDGVYKGAPELVTVTMNETGREQSKPHWNLAQGMFDLPDPPVSFNWFGGSYTTQEYKTMTDDAKAEFSAEAGEGENDG